MLNVLVSQRYLPFGHEQSHGRGELSCFSFRERCG